MDLRQAQAVYTASNVGLVRLPPWAVQTVFCLATDSENSNGIPPIRRFQWIYKRRLAVMGWPQFGEQLCCLLRNGIRRLVSLNPDARPPVDQFPSEFYWIEIPVAELTAPTLLQIRQFICFCDSARENDEAVGVCDRVGRGTSGVFAACYLVRYCCFTAQKAIMHLRQIRPEAIDTVAQQQIVEDYYKELCSFPPQETCWQSFT